MKHELLHFLKLSAHIFTSLSEILHISYAPAAKIFIIQQCRQFVMTVEYVNRENAHILKKISTHICQFTTLLEHFKNLHKSLFPW